MHLNGARCGTASMSATLPGLGLGAVPLRLRPQFEGPSFATDLAPACRLTGAHLADRGRPSFEHGVAAEADGDPKGSGVLSQRHTDTRAVVTCPLHARPTEPNELPAGFEPNRHTAPATS